MFFNSLSPPNVVSWLDTSGEFLSRLDSKVSPPYRNFLPIWSNFDSIQPDLQNISEEKEFSSSSSIASEINGTEIEKREIYTHFSDDFSCPLFKNEPALNDIPSVLISQSPDNIIEFLPTKSVLQNSDIQSSTTVTENSAKPIGVVYSSLYATSENVSHNFPSASTSSITIDESSDDNVSDISCDVSRLYSSDVDEFGYVKIVSQKVEYNGSNAFNPQIYEAACTDNVECDTRIEIASTISSYNEIFSSAEIPENNFESRSEGSHQREVDFFSPVLNYLSSNTTDVPDISDPKKELLLRNNTIRPGDEISFSPEIGLNEKDRHFRDSKTGNGATLEDALDSEYFHASELPGLYLLPKKSDDNNQYPKQQRIIKSSDDSQHRIFIWEDEPSVFQPVLTRTSVLFEMEPSLTSSESKLSPQINEPCSHDAIISTISASESQSNLNYKTLEVTESVGSTQPLGFSIRKPMHLSSSKSSEFDAEISSQILSKYITITSPSIDHPCVSGSPMPSQFISNSNIRHSNYTSSPMPRPFSLGSLTLPDDILPLYYTSNSNKSHFTVPIDHPSIPPSHKKCTSSMPDSGDIIIDQHFLTPHDSRDPCLETKHNHQLPESDYEDDSLDKAQLSGESEIKISDFLQEVYYPDLSNNSNMNIISTSHKPTFNQRFPYEGTHASTYSSEMELHPPSIVNNPTELNFEVVGPHYSSLCVHQSPQSQTDEKQIEMHFPSLTRYKTLQPERYNGSLRNSPHMISSSLIGNNDFRSVKVTSIGNGCNSDRHSDINQYGSAPRSRSHLKSYPVASKEVIYNSATSQKSPPGSSHFPEKLHFECIKSAGVSSDPCAHPHTSWLQNSL